MGEGQGLALGHVGSHLLVIDVRAQLVGHQHHDDVTGLGSLFHFHHLEVGVIGGKGSGLFPVGGALAQANHDVDAAFGQVLRMGVALASKANDGDGLSVQHAQVAVSVVILLDRHVMYSPLILIWHLEFATNWGVRDRRKTKKPLSPVIQETKALKKHSAVPLSLTRTSRAHSWGSNKPPHVNGCTRSNLLESIFRSADCSEMISRSPILTVSHQTTAL